MNTKKLMKLAGIAFAALVLAACAARGTIAPMLESAARSGQGENPEAGYVEQAGLSAEELREAEGYSGDVKEVEELLERNVWTRAGSTGEKVTFARGYAKVERAGEVEAVKLVFKAVQQDTLADGNIGYWISANSAAGTAMAKLYRTGDGEGGWAFECPGVLMGDTVVPAGRVEEIAVEDLNESVTALLGGDENVADIKEKVAEAVATRAPRAKAARWTGEVALDYTSKSIETTYEADDASGTRIRVRAGFGGANVEVG